MKRLQSASSIVNTQDNQRTGRLPKKQQGFVLRQIVHDFELACDEGCVYEIADDNFHRVERFLNSQYDDYKN